MKVKVQFELDLSGTSYDVNDIEEFKKSGVIQSIGTFLYDLHLYHQRKILETYDVEDLELRESLKFAYTEDCKLSSQLFNNYSLELITNDNHVINFTHKDPGYIETLNIDGKEVKEY